MFKLPEPTEPFQRIHLFNTADRVITQDCVSVEQDSWRIESYRERTVLIFEFPEPEMKECLLLCRAQIKTANLHKPAKLQLNHQNAVGWSFSRWASVDGTTNWHSCEVTHYFKKEPSSGSGLIKISVEFEGGGVVWLKDIELLKAAVKPPASDQR